MFIPTWPIYGQVREEKTADKKFWTVNGIFIGSAVFDTWSTFNTLDKCPRCVEGNPILRPFVKKGEVPTYAFVLGTSVGVSFVSWHLKKKGIEWWWLPPILGATGHFVAGVHNIKIGLKF